MSTPSPQPLDYDLVSPYAPKYARDPAPAPAAAEPAPSSRPRPGAIENDHDAKILDEIEASLRAMIDAEHKPEPQSDSLPEEQAPEEATVSEMAETSAPDEAMTPTIDTLDAPALAEDLRSTEHRYFDALRVQEVMQQVAQQLASRNAQAAPPVQPHYVQEHVPAQPQLAPQPELEKEPDEPMQLYRLPPAFLAQSMEPIRLDETEDASWPKARPKRRSSASTLFVRFGFAAGGAAAVMMFALPDLRARFFDSVGTPFSAMTSNAVAVFGEGKPQPARNEPIAAVAVRTEPIVLARESERIVAPIQRPAPAAIALPAPEPRVSARSDSAPAAAPAATPAAAPESQPRRETVMTPIAPPAATQDAQNRNIWHGPPGRVEGEARTNGVATRALAAEEIELLRKMGKDFIAAGDLAGARGVLERAADAGDASAALALAATYDLEALARFKVKGMVPDNAKAAFWYERARDLGSQEAPARLKALARSN